MELMRFLSVTQAPIFSFLLKSVCGNPFSHFSSETVDMPFKVAVVKQLSKNVLHKGWNGARIESKLFLISIYKVLGKNHISDTQRRRNCFWEGVQIYNIIVFRKSKQRVRRLGENRELWFKIILNNVSVALARPPNIFVTFGRGCRNPAWIAAIWHSFHLPRA